MIFSLLRGENLTESLIGLGVRLFTVLCILPIHELAHAFIADKLGDDTARSSGRLTLDPFSHLDIFGALMIVLVGFGYAKPVPVNPSRTKMKNKKAAMAVIAAAGPISNLLIALVSALIYVPVYTNFAYKSMFAYAVSLFLYYCAIINVNLAIFNLIPIPPLDGSRILTAFLPNKTYYKLLQYERYITIVIFILLFTGLLSKPISILSSYVMYAFIKLGTMIF